jgi:hypothetical protein
MPQLDTVGVSIRQDGFSQITPGLNYSNPDALFLTNTIYGSGYGKVPQVEDRLKGGKLAATIALPDAIASWAPDIDIGVNYADRRKVKTQSEGNILLGAQGDANIASDLQYRPVNRLRRPRHHPGLERAGRCGSLHDLQPGRQPGLPDSQVVDGRGEDHHRLGAPEHQHRHRRSRRARQHRRADAAHRPELGFALLGQLAAGRQQRPAVFAGRTTTTGCRA